MTSAWPIWDDFEDSRFFEDDYEFFRRPRRKLRGLDEFFDDFFDRRPRSDRRPVDDYYYNNVEPKYEERQYEERPRRYGRKLQTQSDEECDENGNWEVRVNVRQFQPEEVTVKLIGHTVSVEAKHEIEENGRKIVDKELMKKFRIPWSCNIDRVESRLTPVGVLHISAPALDKERKNNAPIRRVVRNIQSVREQPAEEENARNIGNQNNKTLEDQNKKAMENQEKITVEKETQTKLEEQVEEQKNKEEMTNITIVNTGEPERQTVVDCEDTKANQQVEKEEKQQTREECRQECSQECRQECSQECRQECSQEYKEEELKERIIPIMKTGRRAEFQYKREQKETIFNI